MHEYECKISVNGRMTVEYVSARSTIDAKKLVEAKYPNCKITWYHCKKL